MHHGETHTPTTVLRVRRGGLQAGTFHWAGAIEASISLPSQAPVETNSVWVNPATGNFDMHLAKFRLRPLTGVRGVCAVQFRLGCMAPAGRDVPTAAPGDGARWRRTLEFERSF